MQNKTYVAVFSFPELAAKPWFKNKESEKARNKCCKMDSAPKHKVCEMLSRSLS